MVFSEGTRRQLAVPGNCEGHWFRQLVTLGRDQAALGRRAWELYLSNIDWTSFSLIFCASTL